MRERGKEESKEVIKQKQKKKKLYNIARLLALYKLYWAAMNKIFIYARPCVNKMTWAFFLIWLQSTDVVFLPC